MKGWSPGKGPGAQAKCMSPSDGPELDSMAEAHLKPKFAEGSPLSRIPIQNYISSISAKRLVKRNIAKQNSNNSEKGQGRNKKPLVAKKEVKMTV